jgi:hypothetical protein
LAFEKKKSGENSPFLYQNFEKENLVAYHLWSKVMDEYSTAVLKSWRNDKIEVLFCPPFNNGRII